MTDSEVLKLLLQYEKMREENKNIYFETEQIIEIATAYNNNEEKDKALSVINYGLSLHPDETELLIEKVCLYMDNNDLPKAKKTLDTISDESEELKMVRAEYLLKEHRLDEAKEIFETLEEKEDINTILDIASLYLSNKYSKEGITLLEPLIDSLELTTDKEEYNDFMEILCNSYADQEQYDLALQFVNKLIDTHPYQVEAWLMLSSIYIKMGEYSKALEATDFALAAEPFNHKVKIRKSICQNLIEETARGEEILNEIAQYGPVPEEYIHIVSGKMFMKINKWTDACNEFSKALESFSINDDETLCQTYKDTAICLQEMECYEQLYILCQNAKRIFPHDMDFNFFTGVVYFKKGDEEKAKEQWNIPIYFIEEPLLSKRILCLSKIGLYCLRNGKLEWAKETFTELLTVDPKNDTILKYAACTSLLLRDKTSFNAYNQLLKETITLRSIFEILGYIEEDDRNAIALAIQAIIKDLDIDIHPGLK
ncbi:tetratricopeptide repeat protein [uncultured Bacteroides sp.]|uniref:tetratricopeptide repeat protein n=1 Tax=uncultured Bacteroides sp. TaxID=162156 RepID=UPI002AAB2C89|nr:tetratricopeptide repeat protein [uncultured Bacteroides sp.]